MGFSPDRLLCTLDSLPPTQRLWIAYSGGRDSHALLQALVGLRPRVAAELRAVHCNHGLHPNSEVWSLHCRNVCARLGLPLLQLRLDVQRQAGRSLEALARAARYRAIAESMAPGDVLLTAHHQDDQAETVLLQLLRGSGVGGLAAMPALTRFPPGWLARPLLGFSAHSLAVYAEEAGLDWIEDPSNGDPGFDRNYLRHGIFPLLRARWPGMGRTLSRSARHCAEALSLVEESAVRDLSELAGSDPRILPVSGLLRLPAARCRAVLRLWIRQNGFPVPASVHLERVLGEVLLAAADRQPVVGWEGAEVRRHADSLYLLRPLERHDSTALLEWRQPLPELRLPGGLGLLRVTPAVGAGLDAGVWTRSRVRVGFRRGGERCRPVGMGQSRSLKRLLQERRVPPWLRDRIPLLYLNGELAAVADIWICESFAAADGRPGMRLQWQRATEEPACDS